MNKFKKITLILCLLPLSLMAQKVVTKSRHMRITHADVTVSYPGVQGAPIFRQYKITVVLRKAMKTLPDTMYADGFAEQLKLTPIDAGNGFYKKGSSITFVATVTVNTAENAENMDAFSKKSSLAGDGVCIIRYYVTKKSKQQPIYLRAKTLNKGAEVFMP
jgi:hypothetical protein